MTSTKDDELRAFAKRLSPKESEKGLISKVYGAIKECLGENKCIQIGSYPRYTAITPIHDLDVLYAIGNWNWFEYCSADRAIDAVCAELNKNFKNPTGYRVKIDKQSHSATMAFSNEEKEIQFSVDIVPAYEEGKNEFGLPTYMVPEIAKMKHADRIEYPWNPEEKNAWVKSDPRGYIEIAQQVNRRNEDFRRTVKIVKFWKGIIRDIRPDIKLKSFHLEQWILDYFQMNSSATISEALFNFFYNTPVILSKPQIRDRARPEVFIDDYIVELTEQQKAFIAAIRDAFLKKMEEGFS